MISSAKRKKIEALVVGTMTKLDPTGSNAETYRKLFKEMSDAEFSRYVGGLLKDEDSNFYITAMPWVNEPTLGSIKAAADFLDIPLDEYVYFRHQSTPDGSPTRTTKRVPVGQLFIRRLQQVLMKKNTQSIDTRQRSPITGQVTGDSKTARNADAENYALTALGADSILRELHGPRADNFSAMNDMHKSIATQGFTRMADLTQDIGKKATLNAFDVYLLGAGLKSDILSSGDVLYWTKRAVLANK